MPIRPWDLEPLWNELPDRLSAAHSWLQGYDHQQDAYPMLQLKFNQGSVLILALGGMARQVSAFFPSQYDRLMRINSNDGSLPKLKLLVSGQQMIRVWDVVGFKYQVYNMVIGGCRDDQHYDFMTSDQDCKAAVTAQRLRENISDFLVSVGWPEMKDRVLVKVKKVLALKQVKHAGQPMDAVTCCFLTNIHLPEWAGLGIGAAHGLGVVREERVQAKPH